MDNLDPITEADRLAGAVWGHLVGDALGVPYEFKPPSEIGRVVWGARGTHSQPPGTWSDDGGLMLALLDSLLSVGFNLEDQGRRFLRWLNGRDYKPGELFDIGGTTSAALRRIRSGTPAGQAGGKSEGDNGNGSLMRILPIALIGRDLTDDQLAQWAFHSSAITHAHPRSQVTCAIYCLVARQLVIGVPPDDALNRAFVAAERCLPVDAKGEVATLRAYRDRRGGGYVLDCFWSAWDAFVTSEDYKQTVVRAVQFGNDTDTTAAVAGGLAGARFGILSIPREWLEAMRGRKLVEELVSRLVRYRTNWS